MRASRSIWSPQNAWRNPKRPSRTVGGPVMPVRASRRRDGGVCGPAAVDAFDGAAGAVGFQDACAHAGGDAHGVGDAGGVQAGEHGGGCGGADGAADGGGVLAAFEEHRVAEGAVVSGHAEPDGDLDPDADGVQELGSGGAAGFGDGECGRHHRRRRVQDGRQMGVVEVERVGECSVEQGGAGFGQAGTGADRGGAALAAPFGDERPDGAGRGSAVAARLLPRTSRTRRAASARNSSGSPSAAAEAARAARRWTGSCRYRREGRTGSRCRP